MKAFKLLALTSCVLLAAGNGVAQQNYSKSEGLLQYVDPYIGSGYHGHVFVGTSVPYGMVQLGPTNIHKGWDWCSGYHYSDSILIGFSHTHLSGTGCTDLCDILIMPLNEIRTPRGNQDDIRDGYASRYSHANEIARPEYYSLLLDRYNIKAELTATDRVGFHRYTYPEGKPASILIDLREGNGSNAYDSYIRKVDDYTVEGLSSVSCDNAAMNLQSELTHWDFDKVVDMSADRWNKQLEKMTVETDDEASKRVFYTAHYHTMIAPTLFCDVNGEYRGMNDMIYTDPKKANYTTLSLWDTYRALNPLMTITQPEMVDHVVNSMISIYRQQDKLPIWPLMSGETDQMPGYSSVPVIADAYLKGFTGFDAEEALQAMIATATYEKQKGVPYVVKKGYIPADKVHEATSIAMEYAVDDWGIAAMARKMGKTEDAETFSKRAHYYKNYFDSSIHFIRPKLEDGSWRTPYEASSDITGLIGQYAHGNEPSHHVAYLYAYAGEQWKTAEKVRFIMSDFYTDQPDGIIGNEDCGQMSAWYLLSSMGLYQVNPSDGVFVFGSPCFKKVEVKVRGGNTFTVEAPNNSKENIYIQKVYLNGKPYDKSYITYQDIINGSTLKFVMGKKPNKNFGKAPANRPVVLNKING